MYAAPHAAATPDRLALAMADGGQTRTFAEFEAAANRAAHLFRSLGLRVGDHVAFVMENNLAMLEAEGGAERTGLYFTCVNHHLAPDEAAYVVDDCTARVVVTSAAKSELAAALVDRCPRVQHWFMAGAHSGQPPAPYRSWERSLAGHPSTHVADERLGQAMLYSSGTTGRPKGIWRPLPDQHPGDDVPAVSGMAARWGMTASSTYLSPAPLYHSAPQGSVAIALRTGATAIVMEQFDAARFLEVVEQRRVTHTQVVPTMFSRLLKLPAEVRERADVSSLRTVVHSAAPCPVPVKQQMIDWFGPILLEFYAASEGIGATMIDAHEWLAHPGSVGRALVGTVEIRDDDGNPLPPGTPGTIWFRDGGGFEYFGDAAKTAEAQDATGAARSVGDVGYLDEDGYLFLTDRKTFMIISGGTNIYPQETENHLVTHPAVLDVAVIGVPHADLGEVVKAVVQVVPGVEPGDELAAELIAFCRDGIAHYKCPRSVDFVDELPRLPTGKLAKGGLRARYWAGHATAIG